MSTRVAASVSLPDTSFIAGSVLPIQRAEELLSTLPGVISARIVASGTGSVEEIHVLTTDEVSPKQTVRNVESALIAHLGMRVSHKKISVATSNEAKNPATQASANAYTPQPTPAKGVESFVSQRTEKADRPEPAKPTVCKRMPSRLQRAPLAIEIGRLLRRWVAQEHS